MSDSSPPSEEEKTVVAAAPPNEASLASDSSGDAEATAATAVAAADDADVAGGDGDAMSTAALEPVLSLRVAEIEADAEHAAQREHQDSDSDSDPSVVIMEAATPSLPGLELLGAGAVAGDIDAELAAASALVTVLSAGTARAGSRKPAEVTSDDILEKQAASNDAAAAGEKSCSSDSGSAEEKPTEGTASADAKAESATSEAKESSAAPGAPAAGEKKPKHTNVDDATAKMIEALEYESATIRDDGEVLVLPKGWSTRASKTHGGKEYYVSPYGHTQWIRPPLRTGIMYKWVHEIEVAFDYGRLGLNLKQITAEPGASFTDLQVHIAEVYKLPNGEPSPAEIYNWGVKPEKRLVVGMRMTVMNGEPLAGFTYNEVLEKLGRVPRPVRIKFADITKGIVGRVKEEAPREETAEEKETRAARSMQNSLRLEYFQLLVAYELHQQVWKISRERMEKKEVELAKKFGIVTAQVDAMAEYAVLLEKERENLVQEAGALEHTIEQLRLQGEGLVPSPEVVKTMELNIRNGELDKEIADLVVENEELRTARAELEESLDAVQHELDQYVDLDIDDGVFAIDVFSTAFLGTFVRRGSIDKRAENARELLLAKIQRKAAQLEDDLAQEQERSQYIESEIAQFKRQMQSAAAASKREDDFISGEKPPQFIFLENRIEYLKKTLRETVAAIAKASNSGDLAVADSLSIRRAGLKDDLKNALDEMQRMEKELDEQAALTRQSSIGQSIVEEPETASDGLDIDQLMEERAALTARLHKRLAKLRAQLQEVLAEVTLASNANDGLKLAELNERRRELNLEMSTVQEQIQGRASSQLLSERVSMAVRPPMLGAPVSRASAAAGGGVGSLRSVSLTNGPVSRASLIGPPMSRPSVAGPPVSRGSLTGGPVSRSSLTGGSLSRASLSRTWSEQERPSITRRLPERQHSRSSSDASMASVAPSVDSNLGQSTAGADGSFPVLSGKLMKHPSHSNERGVFGNMSLRGFQDRWCVIDPEGYLRYYKRKGDKQPRGSIPLAIVGLEVVQAKSDGKPNEFLVCSPTHQTRFTAKTPEEMRKWMEALELAHKILIANGVANSGLQRQESTASTSSVAGPTPADEESYRASRATLGF